MEELRKTTDPKDIIISLLQVIQEQSELIKNLEDRYLDWRHGSVEAELLALVENSRAEYKDVVENAKAFIQHDFKVEMS